MDKKTLGKMGENIAIKYLTYKKYKIIDRNFYCRYGEIDIVALSPDEENKLIFVEVKTRVSERFGSLEETINYQKREKIIKSALVFLNSSTKKLALSWRIDFIGLKLNRRYKLEKIVHIKNI